MTSILFHGLLVLAGFYLLYWLVGLPFYSESYRPSARGFLTFLLAAIGLSGFFSGDDGCDG